MGGRSRTLTVLTATALAAGLTQPVYATAATTLTRTAVSRTAASKSGRSVVEWNRDLISILSDPKAQPATVHPTRSFAILQAAEYDAVVSITRTAPSYLFSVTAPREARADAAADQAAHDVLAALYPAHRASVDQRLATQLAAIPDGRGKRNGVRVGNAVARRLIALRSRDGSSAIPARFAPGIGPGAYRPTPGSPAPVYTNWGSVKPFVLASAGQFRPAAPPPVTSAAYATALNQVKSLGQDTSTTRTPDQTASGKFWAAAPIWNLWNQATQQLVTAQKTDLDTTVKAFAELNLSLADTVIALYDAKYHYRVWRPVTAIRLATTHYNPRVTGNPHWTPLLPTAPDPSYPGAHAALSQAAQSVLTAFFGAQHHLTLTAKGSTRTFDSIPAAADDATLSRLWAGQHTDIDNRAGLQLGSQVAGAVSQLL